MPHIKTIQSYINEPVRIQTPIRPPLKNVIPSNYRLLIHPVFSEGEPPFSFNGSVYITLSPVTENVLTIELDSNNLTIDVSNVILNRRVKSTENVTNQETRRVKRDVEQSTEPLSPTTETNVIETEHPTATPSLGPSEEVTESNIPTELPANKNEYEFLELTTGIDATSQESEEMLNSTVEILSTTTSKADLVELPVDENFKKELHTEMLIKKVVVDEQRKKIIISLGLRLMKGLEYVLRVDFLGNMATAAGGLIYTSYKNSAGNERYTLIIDNVVELFTEQYFSNAVTLRQRQQAKMQPAQYFLASRPIQRY